MSDSSDFQFHRERKKEVKEKIEDTHLWVKCMSNDIKSVWSFVYINSKKDITFVSGKVDKSNDKINDRIQLIPVIEFLEWISGDGKKRSVTVYSDNNYLVNVLKEWIHRWKKTQFKFPDGTDRPNSDLLMKIESLVSDTTLNMKHLFSKNEFTEKAEDLCRTELNLS